MRYLNSRSGRQSLRCGRIAPEVFDACNSREQLVQKAMDGGAGATFAGNQKGGNELRVIKKMCKMMTD